MSPQKKKPPKSQKSFSQDRPPTIVIIGRPNVGKSTLFNRLCENRRAIMSSVPGTTRDWLDGYSDWGNKRFHVIDTGGYSPGEEVILSSVRKQVDSWVREADLVLWVVDGKNGLTTSDETLSQWVRQRTDNCFVVINKVDHETKEIMENDFYQLGFSEIISLSAVHGRKVNRLLDKMESFFKWDNQDREKIDSNCARVALVGRPNVGKSSLLNCLLKEDRMIVSDVPGTTRDTTDTLIERHGRKYLFMDTAGLRTKKSKADDLEGLTRLMSERALDRCDVALLMIDGVDGICDGDIAVGRLIQSNKRGSVVGINKWDLVLNKAQSAHDYRETYSDDLPFIAHSPLAFLSAKTGHKIDEVLEKIWHVFVDFNRSFEKDELESFFWKEIQNRHYSHKGHKLNFRGAEQVATSPPVILVKSNMTNDDIHFSYLRYLENRFREYFGMAGVSLNFRFKRGR